MSSPFIVFDLWRHFGLHLVLEDPGGCLVTLEALSEVILLQEPALSKPQHPPEIAP